jgi:hypothetical protein
MGPSFEVSFVPNEGNHSQLVAVTTTSAQSTVLYTVAPGYVNIISTIDCFVRMGVNPVALNTGVDQFMPAGNMMRVGPVPARFRLAFIAASGAGTVYITKES